MITIEKVSLVVFGVAIVIALLDAYVIALAGKDKMLIFPVVLGQWVALGIVELVLLVILTSTGWPE